MPSFEILNRWFRSFERKIAKRSLRIESLPYVEQLEVRQVLSRRTITGVLFQDTNGDGIRQSNEAAVASKVVEIVDSEGHVLRNYTTKAKGTFKFNKLTDGDYTIHPLLPSGWTQSAGIFSVNSLVKKQRSAIAKQVGIFKLGSISGSVFQDAPTGEKAGLAGRTVQLLNANNAVVGQTLTDQSGNYTFSDMVAGSYRVQQVLEPGWLQASGSSSYSVKIQSGTNSRDNSFGDYLGQTLSGYVYSDANADGDRTGDPGIEFVTVTLTGTDNQGATINLTAITDAAGHFEFSGLRPSDAVGYSVTETQPDGFFSGTNTTGNSGGIVRHDVVSNIVLADATDASEYNFGELIASSISGTIFVDANNDGSADAETGIAGTTIILTGIDSRGEHVTATTTTDVNGTYHFINLRPGTYSVAESQPAQYLDGQDAVGSVGGTVANDIIDEIVLVSETIATNYNFGELPPASISGSVYIDANNDGVQQIDETPLADVTVTLTGTDELGATVWRSVTTTAEGTYSFGLLRPGTYVVTESQPGVYLDGQDTVGNLGGADADDSLREIVLSVGAAGTDYNFAELQASSLSGDVYHDRNNDAVRQLDEESIAGVTVTLSGTDDLGSVVTLVASTDSRGHYSFGNLRPGAYVVAESQPDGYLTGTATVGTVGGTVSSDVLDNIELPSGTDGADYSFGELLPSSLSGMVYIDGNNDGSSIGDLGILATAITLSGTDDQGQNVTLQTTTDANGYYRFDHLRPGMYTVTETQPVRYLDGQDVAGSIGGLTGNNLVSEIALNAGSDATGYNFGELIASSLSGYAYVDANNDGVRQDEETGLANVTVTLTGTDDLGAAVTMSTTSDINGLYSFVGLRQGTYSLTETQPSNYLDGTDAIGSLVGTLANDSFVDVQLSSGADGIDYDFGELEASSLSGIVYVDANNDGVYQDTEESIASVTIMLSGTDDMGPVDFTTTTNSDGLYSFDDLRPGSYIVTEIQPAGFLDGKIATSLVMSKETVKLSGDILLSSGVRALDNNFGELRGSSVAGYVYDDADNDGIMSDSDSGITGVTITLTGTDDLGHDVSFSTTTDASGHYNFGDLRPGVYSVTESQPSGYLDGQETSNSHDATVADNLFAAMSLVSGSAAANFNFGELRAASLSGYVYVDANNDGIKQGSESVIAGASILLTGTDDLGSVSRSTQTDASGAYSFGNLRPGKYTVTEVQPAGYTDSMDTIGSAGGIVANDLLSNISLTSRTNAINYNFGEHIPGSIGGNLYRDTNGNGVFDPGEAGLSGFVIELRDGTGTVLQRATTDVTGAYSFGSLATGNYTVAQVIPSGWINSSPLQFNAPIGNNTTITTNFGDRPGILVTPSWLQSQGSAPYILNQANTTYQLATDVTTDGTAFVIGAANVVFDLNGHTITYGNSAPIDVFNGGFEQGSGSNVPGWDLSQAPGAVLMPARVGMWGSSMLSFSSVTSDQTLVSSPIEISVAGREYTATVTPKGNYTSATLKVIDTVTGAVVSTSSLGSTSHGFAVVTKFTPTSTNPVRLQITLAHVSGGVSSVDLDYAAVMPSGDSGILASPSPGYFASQLKTTAILAAIKNLSNFTVLNGSIVQGQGQTYGSTAVNGTSVKGLTVNNLSTFVNGMDSMNLQGTYATNVSIQNSTFDADIDNISDRMDIYASIKLSRNSGNILVSGNKILNSPQAAINIDTNTGGTVTVMNNYISQRAIVSNPYGIMVSGLQDFVIANNTIDTTNGRGIDLDSYGSASTQRGEVYGNYVNVAQTPNLEYTANAMSATALRIRNWGVAQKGLSIHDNTFIATTGDGGVSGAIGLRIKQENPTGEADGAGNMIQNNIFKAIVTTTNKAYYAAALAISGVDPGTGLTLIGNDLQSNDISLNLGDSDSAAKFNADVLFMGTTFTRSNEGAIRPYTAIQAGSNNNSLTDIRLIDNRYANGSTPGIVFKSTTAKDIEFGWSLNVAVVTESGVNVAAAQVQVFDGLGNLVYTTTTDSSGAANDIALVTKTVKQSGANLTAITTVDSSTFRVVVKSGDETVTRSIDVTGNMNLSIEI